MPYYLQAENPLDPMPASKFLDGDPFKVALINPPIPGPQQGPASLDWGAPVEPTYLPTQMCQGGGRKGITDIGGGASGVHIVSLSAKQLIEQVEPDVHQFFPIEVVDRKGKHLADHWVWVICNRIDSVDRDLTTYHLVHGATWMSNYRDQSGHRVRLNKAKMVFNLSQIGDRHFWRDKHVFSNHVLMSDKAKALFDGSNLKGFKFSEYLEVV